MTGLRRRIGLMMLALLIAAGGTYGYARWRHGQVHVETDDAYVQGSIHMVASRLSGYLLSVKVRENQDVQAGDVIAEMDPADLDAAVFRVEAQKAEAEAGVARAEAAIAQAEAYVETAAGQLSLASLEKDRATELYRTKTLPKRDYDRAVTAERVGRSQWEAAKRGVSAAKAELEVRRKSLSVSEAGLRIARLQRSYCTVRSPVNGVVSRKTAEAGQVVAPGQPLCAVAPMGLGDLWVEANLKETQLKKIRPGQRATVRADVDGSRVYAGTVESLSAGTGAAFSLLPPENATGNWVKVVQRLPVRIKFDHQDSTDRLLRIGLSVTVSIDTESL